MNADLSLVFLGLMVFLAHLFASFYSRRMVPDVLLLIFIGLLVGPVAGIVKPEQMGDFGQVFVAVTLVVILFEGGTTLSIQTMKTAWKSTMTLTFSSFIVSVILVALIAYLFLDFSLNSSIMLGSILGGTSSAVVIPLVKQLNMGEESRTALILESALTDVLCIVFTLACIETYNSGGLNFGHMLGSVISSFTLAALMGVLGALIWSRILTRVRRIQNSIFTTPAFVFVIYGTAQLLGFSGAIAALTFGITMANVETFRSFLLRRILGGEGHKLNDTELVFLREIVFLLKTFFFVYIGISILFEDFASIMNGLIITVVLFVARILITRYVAPKSSDVFDKTIISIMVPKGLAAAVLATLPERLGVPEGTLIKNIVYATVLFSILMTSLLIIFQTRSPRLRHLYESFFKEKTLPPSQ